MRTSTRCLTRCLLTLIAIVGCRNRVSPAEPKRIVCENDLQPVAKNGENLPEKYRSLINAFGQLGKPYCTVTHLGNGIAITAGHCLNAPKTRANKDNCIPLGPIRWGARVDSCEQLISHCVRILAYEYNQDRDYAIFKMDNVPPVSLGADLNAKPAQGRKATLFGFPQSRPLEWSKFCSIELASNAHLGATMFTHQCDTEGGSSGSAVIDDETLKVIGIHNGTRDGWNYGTFVTDTPVKEFLNWNE